MIEKTDKIEKESGQLEYPSNSVSCTKQQLYSINSHSYSRSGSENISHIINRRNRILNHIRREQFLICFPSTHPFLNEKNAIEYLLPYHFFINETTEDFLFSSTKSENRSFDIDEVVEYTDKSIESIEDSFSSKYNVVLDLMDLEAHKFILNKYTAHAEEITHRVGSARRRPSVFPNRSKLAKRNSAIIRLKVSPEEYKSHRYVRAVNEKLFFRREQ